MTGGPKRDYSPRFNSSKIVVHTIFKHEGSPKIVAQLRNTAMRAQRTVNYDHALGAEGSHRKAAETLADAFGLTLGNRIDERELPGQRAWEAEL